MKTEYKIIILSVALSAAVWIIDVGLLTAGVSGHSVYVGLVAMAGFLWLGVLTSRFLARQERVEKELCRVNRALKTLGECNEAMVRAAEEPELLHNICQTIVRVGGYHLAWVGFAQSDEAKYVRPVAQAGCAKGYLEGVNITWADTERGRGPTGTVIRTGRPCVVRNILTDPDFAPWRAEASKRGYVSVIGLPLNVNGRPFGALTIYAKEPDAFDEDEVKLLTDLADDLAYGIMALRTQIEHRQVEETLRRTEAKKQAIFNAIPDMIMQISKDGWYKSVKLPKDFALWLPPDELIGKNVSEVLPADVAQQTINHITQALQTGSTQIFEYQLPVDRTLRDYEARIVVCNENEVTAIVRDITGRKAREAVIEEERARIARDLHDGLAQNLYFVGLKLDYLCKKVKAACEPEDVSSELCALKKTVQANIDDVRRTIFSLRPLELEKLGFGPAVRKYIQEFGEQARLSVALEIQGNEQALPPALEPIFFRLVQEGLNNIAKHAKAEHAWIELAITPNQAGHLTIRDDGIGFNPETLSPGDSTKMGLGQMRERVKMLGGQFSIESVPMQGTKLCAQIPLEGSKR
ncbi:MAG: GAF domain-containing protein [Anaerolineae bacterium]|nr:GAF domain-containing protein [Anaerolineae bacterium]